MEMFRPLMYKKSILDIDYSSLKKRGIKIIIFDLDNTIVKVDENIPSKEVIDLINKLLKDFRVIIASNNINRRVKTVSEILKCDYYANLRKPTKKLKKMLEKDKVNFQEVCLIGDQMITDILLGNRIGVLTILVDPLGKNDLKITYFNRLIEKVIMKRIKFKKGEYYEK